MPRNVEGRGCPGRGAGAVEPGVDWAVEVATEAAEVKPRRQMRERWMGTS